MTVHLLATPNVQQTKAFVMDGFAMITLRFCEILKRLGVQTILYGSEETDASVSKLVTCISKAEIETMLAGQPYQRCNYAAENPMFGAFNARASSALAGLKRHGDLIATICGTANGIVSQSHPDLTYLEWSVGYQGVAAHSHRIYQSHAWRSCVHGYTATQMGREFDAVIPPFYDVATFTPRAPEDYVLFVGRTDPVKGAPLACRIAQEAGVRLVLIGYGDAKEITYGENLGSVSDEERNRLLAGALCVLMPTRYIEPFGQVSAEAQLCGTPVLGPDFGAYVETIDHGVSGYRCTSLGEYVAAVDLARSLNRHVIRDRAVRLWSLETAVESYRRYFARLARLRADGFDSLEGFHGSDGLDTGSTRDLESAARRAERYLGTLADEAEAVA